MQYHVLARGGREELVLRKRFESDERADQRSAPLRGPPPPHLLNGGSGGHPCHSRPHHHHALDPPPESSHHHLHFPRPPCKVLHFRFQKRRSSVNACLPCLYQNKPFKVKWNFWHLLSILCEEGRHKRRACSRDRA